MNPLVYNKMHSKHHVYLNILFAFFIWLKGVGVFLFFSNSVKTTTNNPTRQWDSVGAFRCVW